MCTVAKKRAKKHFEWSNSAMNRKNTLAGNLMSAFSMHRPAKNIWEEGKDRVEGGEKKLGILWTHRHASKQQVSCERAVGEIIYMCVHSLHTLWAAVCQWSGERGGGYAQVIGGSREPYFMWASLSLEET